MDKENLNNIAVSEARKALGIRDDVRLKFGRRGGEQKWDEDVHRNVFRANFRVWKPVALVDMELDAETGEILSWIDQNCVQESGDETLTGEEAIRIAEENVELPRNAGYPQVRNVLERGKPVTLVVWTYGTTQLTSRTLEVMLNPETRKICGIRQN